MRRWWCLGLVGVCVSAALAQKPPRYPGAGTVIQGPVRPPVNALYALEYDGPRRGLWLGLEASVQRAGQADLLFVDPAAGFQVLTSLRTDELRGAGASGPQVDGPVNELALLGNGRLLCLDFNGDLKRFDDTLFLVDPGAPGRLQGVWYLDDLGCPGSCARNTNTNNPRDRIDYAAGLAVRRTYSITARNQGRQQIFVGQYLPNAVLRMIELTPGTPGTWATRRSFPSPTGDSIDGIDWDPDLQTFWMTSTATGMVYEVAFDEVYGTFRVVQAFPSAGRGGAMAVTVVPDSVSPHVIIEGESFSFQGSIHVVDTGHVGSGQPVVADARGPGPVRVGVILDPQDCAGLPFRLVVSATPGLLPVGERYLALAPDPIFYWSLTNPRFAGTVDGSGRALVELPGSLPPGLGPLYMTFLVFGNPRENYLGLKRITRTVPHVVQ